MVERHKNPIVEAVDQFLSAPTPSTLSASLSASVPQELKVVLRDISRELNEKVPDRLLTAAQIAIITKIAYNKANKPRPEILGNIRAFGRYLQKYPAISGFTAEGTLGNRRTYKPLSTYLQKQFPLDT